MDPRDFPANADALRPRPMANGRRPVTDACSHGDEATTARPRDPDRFLKGPVPWPWLMQAMALPGKALAVGLMLWLEHGMTGRKTDPKRV